MGSSGLKLVLGACAGAVALGVAAPAHAEWVDRHGYLHYGPPPWAYAAPVYVAPPVYAPPVVVVAPRVWVPAHWWRGAWFPGHWR